MLTTDPEKLRLYRGEGHLCHVPEISSNRLPDVLAAVDRHALIVVQPDCVVRRNVETCVDFLIANDFDPIHAVRFRLSPQICDALWRFDSHEYTDDSREVARLVCNRGDSLLILVRDVSAHPSTPASTRLTRLKGSATPSKRAAYHLRSILVSPNELLVFVHTADEPIDVIRETAIILGSSAMDFLSTMQSSGQPVGALGERLQNQIVSLYGDAEPNDLNVENAFQRLGDKLSDTQLSHYAGEVAGALRHLQASGDRISWPGFVHALTQAGQDPLSWDALVIASHRILLGPLDSAANDQARLGFPPTHCAV